MDDVSTAPAGPTAAGMKLVEEYRGTGELVLGERVFAGIAYRISRFQAMAASGLPVPGLHRVDGRVDLGSVPEPRDLVDRDVTLRLEDGRSLRITIAAQDGRVLTEGHGPSRCQCC